MEELLRDFLTDISANYKIDKYHLKMQRKNQFVKISFYELVLFWSNSANLNLSAPLYKIIPFFRTTNYFSYLNDIDYLINYIIFCLKYP